MGDTRVVADEPGGVMQFEFDAGSWFRGGATGKTYPDRVFPQAKDLDSVQNSFNAKVAFASNLDRRLLLCTHGAILFRPLPPVPVKVYCHRNTYGVGRKTLEGEVFGNGELFLGNSGYGSGGFSSLGAVVRPGCELKDVAKIWERWFCG